MTQAIGGLTEIAGAYDGVLVDQYGVLHDGRVAVPGARGCLAALAARGMPVAMLTNSGKSARENADRLATLGFDPGKLRGIVTSGDLARARIAAMLEAGQLRPGDAVRLIARGAAESPVEDLGLRLAEPGAPAALVLIAGAEPERLSRAAYAEALAPLARDGVPAICANPDRLLATADGAAFGPGVIAEDYAAAGGAVEVVGKPGRAMFAAGLAALGDPPPARVLMIGDSLEHDIAGAAALGIATLFIRSGVQAGLAGAVAADYAMPELAWDG